ncbi:hypothetical protein Tco_0829403 [Tanacetum coccineum]
MGQSLQTIHMLGKTPNEVYDPFLKGGFGYKNPERLKKAIAVQQKMYDGEKLYSAKLIINLPDLEEILEDAEENFSVEQRYFSIPSTSTNSSKSKEVTLDLPIPKMPEENKLLKMFDTLVKDSTTYVSKQQQQQEWDAWVEEAIIDEDEVIPEDETPELITELHDVNKRVPTIFDYERIKDTLNDALSNQFKNAKEITDVVRITTDQPHGLDFMEQIIMKRENDKPDSFFESDFKYMNKNDIEDLYHLCQNKKVNYRETKLMNSLITFIKSRVTWERVHDFQLGIESYQIKVNLTAPTLTFPGIEAREPYSIVDKPSTGLIYFNSKDEKRVMYLMEIVKYCDATLEKVLKEVKLKIFQSEPCRKQPLLGELDRDILRAFEREITKRLSYREQMRRWKSFVNGRPILPTMKRLK